jgi:pyridoxine kinase
MGAKVVVLKGITRDDGMIRNYVAGKDIELSELTATLLPFMLHGTGDLFASALIAAVMCGKDVLAATDFAGQTVTRAMGITRVQPDFELRGVSFEPVLGDVCALLR